MLPHRPATCPSWRAAVGPAGRRVFLSAEAGCAKCHTAHSEGGTIGPNLSNLAQRDYASVLRDVAEPSFAINPDYISQVIALDDGRVLEGTVRTVGNQLQVADTKGQITLVERSQIDTLTASTRSIMPEGLPKLLGADKLKDLLTFLLTEPPHMPDYGGQTPPSPRPASVVRAVLAGAPNRRPKPGRCT